MGTDILYQSIDARGAVRTDFTKIREKLGRIPALKQVSHGTRLVYKIGSEANVTLEIWQGGIRIRYLAETSAVLSRAYAVVRLLAVLSVLRGDYEVDFWSIYHDIIEALDSHGYTKTGVSDIYIARLERQLESMAFSNANLAGEAIKLHGILHSLEDKIRIYAELCSKVIEYSDNFGKGVNRVERLESIIGRDTTARVCEIEEVRAKTAVVAWKRIMH